MGDPVTHAPCPFNRPAWRMPPHEKSENAVLRRNGQNLIDQCPLVPEREKRPTGGNLSDQSRTIGKADRRQLLGGLELEGPSARRRGRPLGGG